MMRRDRLLTVSRVLAAVGLLWLATAAAAQPSADEVLSDLGLPADAKRRVLTGEFVTGDLDAASERDLAVSIAFLVKTSPQDLAQQIMTGDILARSDAQVRAHGTFKGSGSVADLSGLPMAPSVAQAYSQVQPGSALNLSTGEIAAFDALAGKSPEVVRQRLQEMLLTRFQAYRAGGLTGIPPYDRGGSTSDPAGDLRKASTAARALQRHMSGFHKVLLGYPEATLSEMQEEFRWASYDIDGTATYVLTHVLSASEGAARAVVQRQYYVSTGYNAEQAVAGFLPVQEGTVVAYTNHTFTDQVAGMGGSVKRNIGRRMMANKLKQIFDRARGGVTQ
jgi:hypothetical protein